MKKLFSLLTLSALTLTSLNSYAKPNDSAVGAYYSTGESNSVGVNLNRTWGINCGGGLYIDVNAGYSQHKATGEQTGSISTTPAIITSCNNFILGAGLSITKNTTTTVSDDRGVMPTILFGYDGDSARVIGKLKFTTDDYDNQGNERASRDTSIYTNLELGVSKTF